MSFYSIYRIVKDITRTIFGRKFWRKFLIVCLIAFGIWFFMHSKGYCYDNTMDLNYKAQSYYDGLMADFIFRLNTFLSQDNQYAKDIINDVNNGNAIYLVYGATDGGSYINGQPVSRSYLQVLTGNGSNILANRVALTSDYMSIETYTMYSSNQSHNMYRFAGVDGLTKTSYSNGQRNIYFCLQLFNYKNNLFTEYLNAYNSGDTQAILELLESIKDSTDNIEEALTSETYDENDVSIGSTVIDNVAASTDGMFTTIFTNFNNAVSGGVSELEIPLPHTEETIVIPSDIVSSHLGNFAYLVQAFWMYVFGLYTWRFVNNLIHRIKDGSILDGFKSDGEVITNTML